MGDEDEPTPIPTPTTSLPPILTSLSVRGSYVGDTSSSFGDETSHTRRRKNRINSYIFILVILIALIAVVSGAVIYLLVFISNSSNYGGLVTEILSLIEFYFELYIF